MKTTNRLTTLIIAFAMVLGIGPGISPSGAAEPDQRVDLKVLVIHDGTEGEDARDTWIETMDREGVPYDVLDSSTTPLTAGFLSTTDHAYYQGVVCATSCRDDLSGGELTILDAFLGEYGIRRVNAYAVNTADFAYFGLGTADDPSGMFRDGDTLTLTTEGMEEFPYMTDSFTVGQYVWGFYAPANSSDHTTLMEGPLGESVVGVYENPAGFEELVVTLESAPYKEHALAWGHGQLSWLTNGIYLGYYRNYFTGHFDDIFLPTTRSPLDTNPTGDTTYDTLIRMVPSDVDRLLAYQAATGVRLDMGYNGGGSIDWIWNHYGDPAFNDDPLVEAFVSGSTEDEFYWINHTFSHLNLDAPTTQGEIEDEISDNVAFAAAHGIPIDTAELITGQHSGLANPAMPAALASQGVLWVAEDYSANADPYLIQGGPATAVPRYSNDVYYDVGTEIGQLAEFNLAYASTYTWAEYVDIEATIMFRSLLENDPRAHYFHQANIAEDGNFYTVFNEVLSRYNGLVTVDLVQPTMTESGEIMLRAEDWDAAKGSVDAYLLGGSVFLTSPTTVMAPMTGLPSGELYGGERSGWIQIGSTPTEVVVDVTAPVITLLGDDPMTIEVGDTYTEAGATAVDDYDGDMGALDPSEIDASAVNTAIVGSYVVDYDISDSSGNPAHEERTVNVVDTEIPVITLVGDNPQTIELGQAYVELGATASDNYDGVIDPGNIVIVSSAVDVNTVGSYGVTYNVDDTSGNPAVEVVRTVNVIDPSAPVITLVGANPQSVEAGTAYVELGATATDPEDGDVSASIVIDASAVDVNALGSYSVTYDVSDSDSNPALQVTRTVNVVDTTKPVISLVGNNPLTLMLGDAYSEPGATASDSYDGDISASIVIDASAVDTSTIGSYEVTYDVVDSSANAAVQVVRTVNVAGDFFTDDDGSVFEGHINAIAAAGITSGCNPPVNDEYCPDAYVTRGQMAKFLNIAVGLDASSVDYFTDDDTSIFEGHINAIAAAGITSGCNPPTNDEYCPDAYVTRGQMAKFLKIAIGLDASSEDFFTDDDGSVFEGHINAIAAAGITSGCNPPTNDEYCPNAYVTRGQMAKFLNIGLDL